MVCGPQSTISKLVAISDIADYVWSFLCHNSESSPVGTIPLFAWEWLVLYILLYFLCPGLLLACMSALWVYAVPKEARRGQ